MNTVVKTETTVANAEPVPAAQAADPTTIRAKIPYVCLRDWIELRHSRKSTWLNHFSTSTGRGLLRLLD